MVFSLAGLKIGRYHSLEVLKDETFTNVLDLVGTGEKGDQGVQGEVGPEGPQGPQGPAGPQGIQGDTGEDGEKGDRGDDGTDGVDGEQGPAGADGSLGLFPIDPAAPPPVIDLGAYGSQQLRLIQPVSHLGLVYYLVDLDASGAMSSGSLGDCISKNALNDLFNAGSATDLSNRTIDYSGHTLRLPSETELLSLLGSTGGWGVVDPVLGQYFWAADIGPRRVGLLDGIAVPVAEAADNANLWHFCVVVTHVPIGALDLATNTDVADEIAASQADLLTVALPPIVTNLVEQLVFNAVIWGAYVLPPRIESLFYAPCVSTAHDLKGGLFVLRRTVPTGLGVHEIATQMSGAALSTQDTLVILPGGPTPPVNPTASGVGITGPWTFEAQFRMTGESDYVSFYLSDDRDVDVDPPEILYHVCLKYANASYVRWLNKTAETNSTESLSVLPKRRWQHVALTYDGANTLAFYLNGVHQHTFTDAPVMSVLDHIKIGPAAGEVREVGILQGVIYTQNFMFSPEGRFNATIAQHPFFGGIVL